MAYYVPPGAYGRLSGYDVIKPPTIVNMNAIIRAIPKGSSVVDIGAHRGMLVKELRNQGYEAFGLDGIPRILQLTKGLVRWCDLTGDCSSLFGCAECGLFLEVGEHIPREFEGQVFANVSQIPSKRLIVSWAQLGVGVGKKRHVNCRTQVYVAAEFARYEWFVDDVLTLQLREDVHSRNLLKERIMVMLR